MYNDSNVEDAKSVLSDIQSDIVERLIDGMEVTDFIWQSDQVQEGIDSVAESSAAGLRPSEAVEILEMYDEFEETDSGLWEGVEGWREQLSVVAYYTYRNAVASAINDLATEIEEIDTDELREQCFFAVLEDVNEVREQDGLDPLTREEFESLLDNTDKYEGRDDEIDTNWREAVEEAVSNLL